jgi:hypothetical protein
MAERVASRGAICLALFLAAGLTAFAAGGCSPQDMQYQDRQMPWRKPEDISKMPLGQQYDTPEKVARLRDPDLRGWMVQWMTLRDNYLAAWRSQGDYGDQVREIKRQRSMLVALIQDREMQLRRSGQPLE